MNKQKSFRLRLSITVLVSLSIWALLVWDHFHGGVPSHHVFNSADMPGISNWWGGLLLPVMTWFLLGITHKRIARDETERPVLAIYPLPVVAGFAGALVFGIALSTLFTFGHKEITSYVPHTLLLLAFLLPIYRAEYVLGFVIGMTFTFGAVLPTGFAAVVALVAAGLYLLVRPAIIWIGCRVVRALKGGSQT